MIYDYPYLDLLKLALPEIVITVTALLTLGAHIIQSRSEQKGGSGSQKSPRGSHLCAVIAVIGLIVAGIAVITLPAHPLNADPMLATDSLSNLFKLIVIGLSFFAVLLSCGKRFGKHTGEYYALLLLATVGLMLLMGSAEFLMIFVGLELTGLSLYVLVAFNKFEKRSIEAGIKYFMFGSTASAFTLFGLSLVYGACGSTNLNQIALKLAGHSLNATPAAGPLLAAGMVMTLIGFLFKVAAAPFHLWAPDAYEGAPLSTSAFIASASKVASFVVLGKILLTGFAPMQAHLAPVLAALACVSILVGNIAALAQSSIRRLLAYSAVAHGGYTLLGLINGQGFSATLFYTTTYAFTLVGAFGVIALVHAQTGRDDIASFAGLKSRSPVLAVCLTLFVLSLAGLPPLAGFFGKLYLFSAVFRQPGYVWLVAVALGGSLISLYYYLAILRQVLIEEPAQNAAPIEAGVLQKITLALLAFIVLALGLAPQILLTFINNALAKL